MSRGSEIADHAAIVKPNGGPAAYPEAPAATHVIGKTPSKGFEDTILSMAQVSTCWTLCAPDATTQHVYWHSAVSSHKHALQKHGAQPQSAFQTQTKYLDIVNV